MIPTWLLWLAVVCVVAIVSFCLGAMVTVGATMADVQRESEEEGRHWDGEH